MLKDYLLMNKISKIMKEIKYQVVEKGIFKKVEFRVWTKSNIISISFKIK
jgi:hypothetical protein